MGTLRITTWNVLADRYLRPRHYPHLGRFDEPEGRAAAQYSLAAGCDVLALQEVEAHLAAAAEHLGDGRGTLWQRRGNSRADGTFLAVRHDHPHHLTGHTQPAVEQVQVVTASLGDDAVLCGDLNDTSGGVVLEPLEAAGWVPNTPCRPTAVVDGCRPATIDRVCGRGRARPRSAAVRHHTRSPLPNDEFPSDHLPLTVAATVDGGP